MAITITRKNQVFDRNGKLLEEVLEERDVTQEVVLLQVHEKLRAALTANSTYLGLTNPTASQNSAHLKALTRQMNALIRMIAADLLVENTDT